MCARNNLYLFIEEVGAAGVADDCVIPKQYLDPFVPYYTSDITSLSYLNSAEVPSSWKAKRVRQAKVALAKGDDQVLSIVLVKENAARICHTGRRAMRDK